MATERTGRFALVTGASGFIGSHLVPALVRSGWSVRATGRRPRLDTLPSEVDYQPADLAGDDNLSPIVDGVSHVFHLAGASSSLADQAEMHRANVVGTARLVEAIAVERSGSGLERFVHMSSTSVYGEEVQLPSPVAENVEPQPSRGYGKAKWATEQVVWEAARAGLPAVVLRPVTVYGPGNVKLLASAILDTAIEAYAGLPRLMLPTVAVEQRLLHIDDLVAATIHLAVTPLVRAFNVVMPNYPTSHDLAEIIAEHIGLPVELTDDPNPGLSYEARVETHRRMVEAGMQPHILLTKDRFRLLRKANRNNRLSVDALLATDFTFTETDLDASIDRTIAWYRDNGWIL